MKMRLPLMFATMLALLTVGMATRAQSVDEAIQNLKYQKFRTAKTELQQYLATHPKDDRAYYYLGLADLGLDLVDSARQDFQQGLQVAPGSPLNTVGMARLDILNGKYDEAKAKIQQAFDASKGRDFEVMRAILEATALSPKADNQYAISLFLQMKNDRKNRKYTLTADDYVALADAQMQLPGGTGDAATNYQNAFYADPKDAQAYDKYADVLLSAHAYDNALEFFHKAIEANPNYPPAYLHLYEYYRLRDLDSAEKYINTYMQLADDKVNAQVNLVDLLYTQGVLQHDSTKYQQAIDKANEIMNQVNDVTQTRLYKLIAVSELALGHADQAKKYMDTYFSRNPDPRYAKFDYQTYAQILMKLNQDSLANVYFAKAIEADTTKDLNALRSIAEELRKQDNFRGASLYYKKILDIADGQASVADYFWYGFSLIYGSEPDSAVAVFKEMAQKFPEKPNQRTAYFYWGQALMLKDTASTGPVGLAIQPLEKYLSLVDTINAENQNQVTRVYYYLAASYLDQNNYDKATSYADKLAAYNPQMASQIYSQIAVNYLHAKNREGATTYAQKALKLNPNDSVSQQILDYYKKLDEYNARLKEYEKRKKESGG
ncbi:MAG: tetratricopeptide repeat protein [Thermoflavifilum sp.]|nr:tetratricopeptide repeat protein [Thermoflavifilum sp.]